MEQKAAHTPAPWHFKKLAMHDGGHVVMFTAQNGQRTHRLDCAGEFKEADAQLIAAAPELLAACKSMIEWDDREKDHAVDFYARMALCEAAFNAARAAIAKAEGGAA